MATSQTTNFSVCSLNTLVATFNAFHCVPNSIADDPSIRRLHRLYHRRCSQMLCSVSVSYFLFCIFRIYIITMLGGVERVAKYSDLTGVWWTVYCHFRFLQFETISGRLVSCVREKNAWSYKCKWRQLYVCFFFLFQIFTYVLTATEKQKNIRGNRKKRSVRRNIWIVNYAVGSCLLNG